MVHSLVYSHRTYKPEEDDVIVVTGSVLDGMSCMCIVVVGNPYLRPGHTAPTTGSGSMALLQVERWGGNNWLQCCQSCC